MELSQAWLHLGNVIRPHPQVVKKISRKGAKAQRKTLRLCAFARGVCFKNPISRKSGFTKSLLAEFLTALEGSPDGAGDDGAQTAFFHFIQRGGGGAPR